MKWKDIFEIEKQKDYFKQLDNFIQDEYKHYNVFPPADKIYTALQLTPYEKVKVVILGQDPYHEKGQAFGLAFAVNDGVKLPPSLINIYKEISNEFNIKISQNGDLTYLAEQGVLLINTVLTVREGMANSHSKKGWEIFTDEIIKALNMRKQPIAFILWGNNARSKKELITNKNHLILESVHPSPLSATRGFFGCNHFIKVNEFLEKNNQSPIMWVKNERVD
ncbi:MAG: uracil-DNA glycosylase [Oscillospiraceae bacterium]